MSITDKSFLDIYLSARYGGDSTSQELINHLKRIDENGYNYVIKKNVKNILDINDQELVNLVDNKVIRLSFEFCIDGQHKSYIHYKNSVIAYFYLDLEDNLYFKEVKNDHN